MKIFLEFAPLHFVPRCATISIVSVYNKVRAARVLDRPSFEFCAVLLRKISYIPDVMQNLALLIVQNKFYFLNNGKNIFAL